MFSLSLCLSLIQYDWSSRQFNKIRSYIFIFKKKKVTHDPRPRIFTWPSFWSIIIKVIKIYYLRTQIPSSCSKQIQTRAIFKLVMKFCKNQCYAALGIEDRDTHRLSAVYIPTCPPIPKISFKIIGFGIWLWLSKLVLCRFLQENHQFFEVFEITRTSGSLNIQRTIPPDTGKNLWFSDTMRHKSSNWVPCFNPLPHVARASYNITIILYWYGEWEECWPVCIQCSLWIMSTRIGFHTKHKSVRSAITEPIQEPHNPVGESSSSYSPMTPIQVYEHNILFPHINLYSSFHLIR
jgi:hypothetical protein